MTFLKRMPCNKLIGVKAGWLLGD